MKGFLIFLHKSEPIFKLDLGEEGAEIPEEEAERIIEFDE